LLRDRCGQKFREELDSQRTKGKTEAEKLDNEAEKEQLLWGLN
jgi:hypothetical protein